MGSRHITQRAENQRINGQSRLDKQDRTAGRTTDHTLGPWHTTPCKSGNYDTCLRTLGSRHMTQRTENQRINGQRRLDWQAVKGARHDRLGAQHDRRSVQHDWERCLDYAQHTERRLAYRTANRHAGRTTDHALDYGAQLPVNQEITTYACVLWGAVI